MAQFYPIVMQWLEAYQPDQYQALKQERRLRAHIEALVGQLYAETDRVFEGLKERYPERSEEQLRLEAEQTAIEQVLPVA